MYSQKKASEEIQNYISNTNIKQGVFLINKNETYCLDKIDDYYDSFDIPDVIEYSTRADWCGNITISAAIFVAKDLSEAKQMFMGTCKGYPSFNCNCVRNSAYICLFSLAYIDGKIVNIFKNKITLEEGIYHELMHRYVNSIDTLNKYTERKKPSLFVKNVLSISDKHCNKTDNVVLNILRISYLIYALSESEMAAYLAQHRERFDNEDISSKKEFYRLLHSSIGSNIIKIANELIPFMDNYLKGNVVETSDFKKLLSEINTITKLGINNIDELLKNLISDWGINSVRKFEKELVKRVDVFKHKLYNVAYDSLPDDVKHKITEEYFSI